MKIPFTSHRILHGQIPPLHGTSRAYYATTKEYVSVSQLITLFLLFCEDKKQILFFLFTT